MPWFVPVIMAAASALAANEQQDAAQTQQASQSAAGKGAGMQVTPTVRPFATGNDAIDKKQAAVEAGNNGQLPTMPQKNYPLTPQEAEKFGTGELLQKGGKGFDAPTKTKDGMSFDDKMQMAAMAASIGSALSGPGAPPPPGAPRGGGIGMSPVFQQMTARNLYG